MWHEGHIFRHGRPHPILVLKIDFFFSSCPCYISSPIFHILLLQCRNGCWSHVSPWNWSWSRISPFIKGDLTLEVDIARCLILSNVVSKDASYIASHMLFPSNLKLYTTFEFKANGNKWLSFLHFLKQPKLDNKLKNVVHLF